MLIAELLSVIVAELNFVRVTFLEAKADAPLPVDRYGVLIGAIASQLV
jgi:hypothetical protein